MAGAGSGHGAGLPRGRRPAGGLPRARSHGGRRPVGQARGRSHRGVRRAGGLAGHAVLQVRGHRADAHRLAHRRGDHHPGLGRRGGPRRPVRRPATDRHR
ncbi:Uncharacterised protein [Streptococcus pneumoniae]|nr:Uncharacterised protein [Streptococcus pneumoniae]